MNYFALHLICIDLVSEAKNCLVQVFLSERDYCIASYGGPMIFNHPSGMIVDSDKLMVADQVNCCIYEFRRAITDIVRE